MNYKIKDIDNLYTEIIKNYIDKGYKIYTEPMGGSQGEMAKIFLECNDDIICIYMKEFHDYCDFVDGIFIMVGTFDRFKAYDKSYGGTIWLNELDCISMYRFFEVSKNKYYTDDYNFALNCNKKRMNRIKNKKKKDNRVTFNSDRFKEFAYKKCKKTKGYKRVKKTDIEEIIKAYGFYYAYIKGKEYLLELNNQKLNYKLLNKN